MKDKSCVWYASYGSNLSEDRFLCYIRGGTPKGSTKREKGCRDKTLPKDHRPSSIPFPLYFAKKSNRWNGGVAFIGLKREEKNIALGRMYLITEEQFFDVVSQENKDIEISIDLEKVKRNGSKVFLKSWYGNIIYLGNFDGYPVFTFTAYWDETSEQPRAPSREYLETMISGLKQIYNLSNKQIIEYLLGKPGVKGNLKNEELESLVMAI